MPETSLHYVVVACGTTGDIHPFMCIAKSMQALGRRVTFITNSFHARLVHSAGIPFVGLGTDEEYLRVVANPDLWDPRKGFSALLASYGDHLKQIEEAIRTVSVQAHQVVIAHPFAVPGAVIARERGLIKSVVAAYLAPSNLRTCHDPLNIGAMAVPRWVPMSWRRALWRIVEKGWIDPVAVAQINCARKSLALPQIHSFLTHVAEAPDLSLTLFPSWFAPAAPDWPRPLIEGDFQLFDAGKQDCFTDQLSSFLAAGDKPIVFTPGTGNVHAATFFACALSASNRIGRRAILLTRERSQVPASALWQPYVSLAALLPHTAALVHHGGIGTTAEALRSGTPQLITPFAWDQFDNAARVRSLGAGMVSPARSLQALELAQSLQMLTNSDTIRIRCAQLATRFNPSHQPSTLCKAVERFALSEIGGDQS